MMNLIDGKDFFESIRRNDINQITNNVLTHYSSLIIRNIVCNKRCRLVFANGGNDKTCLYTVSWTNCTIYLDPVAALKDSLIRLNYDIKSEIIADRLTDATSLKEHYHLINKEYKSDHLVIGYEFTLKAEEEKKREKNHDEEYITT